MLLFFFLKCRYSNLIISTLLFINWCYQSVCLVLKYSYGNSVSWPVLFSSWCYWLFMKCHYGDLICSTVFFIDWCCWFILKFHDDDLVSWTVLFFDQSMLLVVYEMFLAIRFILRYFYWLMLLVYSEMPWRRFTYLYTSFN